MNVKKLGGFVLVLASFVLLFEPAFINIGHNNPTVQLFAYVGMLTCAVVAGFLTNQGEGGH